MKQLIAKLYEWIFIMTLAAITIGLVGITAKVSAFMFHSLAVLTESVEIKSNGKCNCVKENQ